ncbi:MAG: hypothetical protein ACEPOZ_20475 [Marinifilaceae bacterium]|jgi:hypothetical protein
MKRKGLNKKLSVKKTNLTDLDKIKGGAEALKKSCYNTTSAMRVHSYCVPAS